MITIYVCEVAIISLLVDGGKGVDGGGGDEGVGSNEN
jgi:hypothetical protein